MEGRQKNIYIYTSSTVSLFLNNLSLFSRDGYIFPQGMHVYVCVYSILADQEHHSKRQKKSNIDSFAFAFFLFVPSFVLCKLNW